MLSTNDIHIRDPFIVPDTAEKKYLMFGTTIPPKGDPWQLVYYTSKDLSFWDGPFTAFHKPENFWADREFWAPEVHKWRNHWYMFVSLKSPTRRRATQILRATTPYGPFEAFSNDAITPEDWECLDGTLYIDEKNKPWMVFCHEWVQINDGSFCAAPLSDDLSNFIEKPVTLFTVTEAKWPKSVRTDKEMFVSDAPFFFNTKNGTLLMLWASHCGKYAQSFSRSKSGNLLGPWEHEQPFYTNDGGHGMLFYTFDGSLTMAIHSPNYFPKERALFLPIIDNGDSISIKT